MPPSAQTPAAPSVFASTPKVKLRMPPGPSGLTLKFTRPKSIDSPGTPGPSPLSSAPVQTLQTLQSAETLPPNLAGPSPKIVIRLPPRSTPVKQEPVVKPPVETPMATPRIKLTFRVPPKKSKLDQSSTPMLDDMMDVDSVAGNAEKPALGTGAAEDTHLVMSREVPATPTPAGSSKAASTIIPAVESKIPETPVKETIVPSSTAPQVDESPKVDETPKTKIKLKFKFNSAK